MPAFPCTATPCTIPDALPERRCLIVDDSRVVRKVARRILELHGFHIEEAENGVEALQACRRSAPECVLLDWNMPIMNGIEFLRALRAEFGPEKPLAHPIHRSDADRGC